MSNSTKKDLSGTVFIGPSSHREERLDTIINAHLNAKWNKETEDAYMESVRTRATTKVKDMLLRAKRRSDEIIAQAEIEAQEINARAEATYADILQTQKKTQHEYENVSKLATQNANATMQKQLAQDRRALGESTAVVLLSIHQQLQSIYDAWRDELRLLTLEAIQVGTGWVADSSREEILGSMLDECVRKLIEKKDYIVRVHPSDGALVTQVLENSREKSWSMEVSSDLAPGSLEVESKHAILKNSSEGRKEFVQGILENLILPTAESDSVAMQSVTNTLMNEMQNNSLLAQVSSSDEASDEGSDEGSGQNSEQSFNQDSYLADDSNNLAQDNEGMPNMRQNSEQDMGQNFENNVQPTPETTTTMPQGDIASNPSRENTSQNMNDGKEKDLSDNALLENEDNKVTGKPSKETGKASNEMNTPKIETPSMVNLNTEAESLVDEFLGNNSADFDSEMHLLDPPASNSDIKEDYSSKPLPEDLAEDLLAEMGFDSMDSTSKE